MPPDTSQVVKPLIVKRGLVHVYFAYDVGLSIELTACQQHISYMTELAHIKHKGHAPQYFQFDPPPLRVTQEITPLEIGSHRTSSTADMVLYDFGGASVRYTIPFSGSFDEMIALSVGLTESPLLRDDSRQRVAHVLAVIEGAVLKPGIAAMSEDYSVFEVDEFASELAPSDLSACYGHEVARLLRSEKDALSEQEVADALANRVSFGANDVAIIDWNGALLFDREPEDVLTVLEFANIQLLEVRFLDAQLDRALDRAYEGMNLPRGWTQARLPSDARAYLRSVGQMQVDGAILFERVSNALKLLGDQYLARVYRAASQRYRLAEWNAGILRKLETIDSIYQKVHDQSTGVRMELMEWIVIVLIAVELLLSLVTALGWHA